jgi:hypothetical protein
MEQIATNVCHPNFNKRSKKSLLVIVSRVWNIVQLFSNRERKLYDDGNGSCDYPMLGSVRVVPSLHGPEHFEEAISVFVSSTNLRLLLLSSTSLSDGRGEDLGTTGVPVICLDAFTRDELLREKEIEYLSVTHIAGEWTPKPYNVTSQNTCRDFVSDACTVGLVRPPYRVSVSRFSNGNVRPINADEALSGPVPLLKSVLPHDDLILEIRDGVEKASDPVPESVAAFATSYEAMNWFALVNFQVYHRPEKMLWPGAT